MSNPLPNVSLPFPTASDLENIDQLLDQGLPIQAFQFCEQFAPLELWLHAGPLESFFASRLISWLGNNRRSHALSWLARKMYPESGDVFLGNLSTQYYREGPWKALQLVENTELHPKLTESQHCFLDCTRARYYSYWQDYNTSLAILDKVESIKSNYDRSAVIRASVLQRADRLDEALEWADIALERRPGNVTAPDIKAEILLAKGKEDEALEVLTLADSKVEDYGIPISIADWYDEREQHEQALAAMKRVESLTPLASSSLKKWMAGRRAFWYYLLGDKESALEQAEQSPDCFTAEIADRLKQNVDGKRVRLAVPFVKQERRTCAPATMAAICRYWGDDADHVEIAEAICYDGTPDHNERNWAVEQGYLAREFRVTPEVTRQLIDQGIPFTFTTVEPASAHLQAVIGYDSTADTMIIREPGWDRFAEFRMKVTEEYAFCGPRGMIILPKNKAGLIEGIELPDADLYDQLHGVQRALEDNDREQAIDYFKKLQAGDSNHRITLIAERALAIYDQNPDAQLSATNKMLELYKDEPALLYTKLNLLGRVAGHKEQLEYARKLIATEKAPRQVHRMLAELLDDDARDWPAATEAWERAIYRSPFDGATLSGNADFLWDLQRREESVELYRLASCVEILSEWDARAYFKAARWEGKIDNVMDHLARRVEDHGELSGDPAITYSWALESRDQIKPALEVLDKAIEARPEDGDLLIYASGRYRAFGRLDLAQGLLDKARDLVSPSSWLSHAANAAMKRGDMDTALQLRRELVEIKPTDREAHSELASLLSVAEGPDVAVAHLEGVCKEYPGIAPLQVLLSGYLEEDLERKLEVLEHIVSLNPASAWGYREWALDLINLNRLEEAEVKAKTALEIAPSDAGSWGVLADVYSNAGENDKAIAHFKKAIELDADYKFAISALMSLSFDPESRKNALNFCLGEMENQVVSGDGLIRWHDFAWSEWNPDDVLLILQDITRNRPDLWQAWSILTLHLQRMGRIDEALATAKHATELFPLLPRVWLDLSEVYQIAGDPINEREALEQVLTLNPQWAVAVLSYAYVCQTLGDHEKAREVLERQTEVDPWNTRVQLRLIKLLDASGDDEAELEYARRATRLSPLSTAAWQARVVAAEGNDAELAVIREETRKQTEKLPLSGSAWECRADVEVKAEDFTSQLAILDEAVDKLPHEWNLVESRIILLTELGQYEEAEKGCTLEGVPDTQKHWRKSRLAWVRYRSGRADEGIELLEAVAKERPDYEWGAQRLLEWHEEKANHEAVIHWSTVLMRMDPELSTNYGFRAGAYLSLEQNDEAEQDLIKAITLSPSYRWAAFRLLELQLRKGDTEAAAKTVERVRGQIPICDLVKTWNEEGFPEQAETYAKQSLEDDPEEALHYRNLADSLWRQEQKKPSLDATLTYAKLLPDESHPWEVLKQRAEDTDALPSVLKQIEQWCLEKPEDRWRWLSLLELHPTHAGNLEAIEVALPYHETDISLLDSKALSLFKTRQYHEAKQHCQHYESEQYEDELRASMCRRGAWIDWEMGNREEAIARAQKALDLEPGNAWTLKRLCDWYEEENQSAKAIPWAEQLVQVAPKDHISFGYLANTFLLADRKDEAIPHLVRSLQMRPTYDWASDELFDIYIEKNDFNNAQSLLQMLKEHGAAPEPELLAKDVCLYAKQGDREQAFAAWDKLVSSSGEIESYSLSTADSAIEKAGWQPELHSRWEKLAEQEEWNTSLVLPWVEGECRLGKAKIWQRFSELSFTEEQRRMAWGAYITAASKGRDNDKPEWPKQLYRALKKEGDYLSKDIDTWAKIAWFFACGDADSYTKRERSWVADWQQRDGLETWMMVNVAAILDSKKDGGTPVRKWSLENLPLDHGASFHRAELAMASAKNKEVDQARAYLRDINEADFNASSNPKNLILLSRLGAVLTDLVSADQPINERRQQATVEWDELMKTYKTDIAQGEYEETLKSFLPTAIREVGFTSKIGLRWLGLLISKYIG